MLRRRMEREKRGKEGKEEKIVDTGTQRMRRGSEKKQNSERGSSRVQAKVREGKRTKGGRERWGEWARVRVCVTQCVCV